MERARQIAAVFAGILVIIVLIVMARWTGDQIKQRFLTPKMATEAASLQAENMSQSPAPAEPTAGSNTVTPSPSQANKTATYSAIPSTGPEDIGYFFLAILAFAGIVSRKFASRLV